MESQLVIKKKGIFLEEGRKQYPPGLLLHEKNFAFLLFSLTFTDIQVSISLIFLSISTESDDQPDSPKEHNDQKLEIQEEVSATTKLMHDVDLQDVGDKSKKKSKLKDENRYRIENGCYFLAPPFGRPF